MVRDQEDTTRGHVAPILGVLGAVGLTIASVALRRSTRGQSDKANDTRKAFATYLREHLAGADAAIHMVQSLRDAYRGSPQGLVFGSLYEQFRDDRAVVEGILAELGYTSRSVKRLAARATGSALRVVAAGAAGDLSLFRKLEALAIGVHGKHCLWRAAQAIVALPHRGKRPCRPCGRTIGQECDTAPCDDAAHFEVREGDAGNGVEQLSFFGLRDEVIAVVQSGRQIVLEEASRSGHDSVSHDGQPNHRPDNGAVRRVA